MDAFQKTELIGFADHEFAGRAWNESQGSGLGNRVDKNDSKVRKTEGGM